MRIPSSFLSLAGRWTICTLAALTLTACGGGGGSGSGGGGGGGGGGGTTYTIGGTVTGLSASGLTLADNGGDSLSVPSGATTFTFATKLQSGASYAVTVGSQPTGETCTVTSGSTGTVSANVTSVVVTCTAATYTISGSITGLSAAGLKLQYYSTGEVLPVAAGATSFAFTQPVPAGTNVKMVVAAQPGFQICTPGASNFSGAISANITADTLSCAAATAQVSLFAGSPTAAAGNANGTGTAATFSEPTGVAIDSSGNLYVADYGNNEIREINSSDVVSTFVPASAGLNGPYGVALDSAGNAYVTDSANQEIRMVTPKAVVTVLAGGSVGPANGTGSAAQFNYPFGIVVDASGNLFVGDFANNEIRKLVP